MINLTQLKQAIQEDKLKDVDISKVMTSWTKQKGHPVVTVKHLNSTHISVRQHRFLLDANYPVSSLNE